MIESNRSELSAKAAVTGALCALACSVSFQLPAALSAKYYVQRGLIAHWDGIENAGYGVHSANITQWADLVSGAHPFVFTGTVTVGANRLTFPGTVKDYATLGKADTAATFESATNGTCETVFDPNKSGTWAAFTSSSVSGIAVGKASAPLVVSAASSNRPNQLSGWSWNSTFPITTLTAFYASARPSELPSVDGVRWTSSANNYFTPPSAGTTILGKHQGNNTSYQYSGHVYAIRLYSDHLTTEEMLHNVKVDEIRFNKGQTDVSDCLAVDAADPVRCNPSACFGLTTNLTSGAAVSVSGPSAWTSADGKTRTVCTGWRMFDKAGAEVGHGEETTFTYTHPGAFRYLEWQQKTEHRVSVSASAGGGVSPAEIWAETGAEVTVTATPDAGKVVCWTAGVDDNAKVFDLSQTVRIAETGHDFEVSFFTPTPVTETKKGLFANYAHAAKVSVVGYGGADRLTDFLLVLELGEGDGGFSYAETRTPNGNDVRFAAADGTELNSEVVTWDPAGTSVFRVRVPSVIPEFGAAFYLLWGNASAKARDPVSRPVWSESFRGVWNFDDPEGCIALDSSANQMHGQVSNSLVRSVSGLVGSARSFPGMSPAVCHLGAVDQSVLEPETFTAECWFNARTLPTASAKYAYLLGSASRDYQKSGYAVLLGVDSNGKVFGRVNSSDIATSTTAVEVATWHHAAFAYAPGDLRIYLDGVPVATKAATISAGTLWGVRRNNVPTIGGWMPKVYIPGDYHRFFDGFVDEVRLSAGNRPEGWFSATYRNIAHHDDFVRIAAASGCSLFVTGTEELPSDCGASFEPGFQPVAGSLAFSVPAEVVTDGVKWTSAGYEVAADGKVVSSGDGTSVSMNWPAGRDVVIRWKWTKRYRVTVAAGAGGAVSPAKDGEWLEPGTILDVTATPSDPATHAFYAWSGNCPTLEVFSASFRLAVDRPQSVTATFAPVYRVTTNTVATTTLADAIASVCAAAPAVLEIDDGDYAVTNAAGAAVLVTLDAPVVVRSKNGADRTVLRQWAKGKMLAVSHPGVALAGLHLVAKAANSVSGPILVNLQQGHMLDCVLDGDRGSFTYTTAALVGVGKGCVRRCAFVNLLCNSKVNQIQMDDGAVVDSCVVSNNVSSVPPVLMNAGSFLRNTLVCGNHPYAGVKHDAGGVAAGADDKAFYYGARVRIENCTVVDNDTVGTGSSGVAYGGGLYVPYTPALVVNSIVSGNRAYAQEYGPDVYGPVAALHSVGSAFTDGIGCSTAAMTYEEGTWRPTVTSVAVDAGYRSTLAQEPAGRDLAGTNRVAGTAIDVGAYEYQPTGREALSVSFDVDVKTGRDTVTGTFTANVVGAKGEVAYLWEFGDGATSTAASPTHTYAACGYYTVRLTVSDDETSVSSELVDLVKVMPSVCYLNASGTAVEPYATRETGSPRLKDLLGMGASRIVVCDGTTATGDYNSGPTVVGNVVIEGESKTNSILSLRFAIDSSGVTVRNLTFANGYSGNSSVIFKLLDGTITNCIFRDNRPACWSSDDRHVLTLGTNGSTTQRPTLVDCEFVRNGFGAVQERINGEAVYVQGGRVTVERCSFVGNVGNAFLQGGRGAAIGVKSGVSVKPIVRNCLFAENLSTAAGHVGGSAIYAESPVVIDSCTFASNVTTGAGAALYLSAGAAGTTITNSIVWGNVSGVTGTSSNDIRYAEGAAPSVGCSCVPVESGLTGTGLVTADPKLLSKARKDRPVYSLNHSSPCLNKGLAEDWMKDAADRKGNPRIFGKRPDLGCYELQSVSGMTLIVR